MTPKDYPTALISTESNTHRLFTVREAARYLSVSVSTLYGWVHQRRIPFVKAGRALRFDLADLDRFIESNRIRPKAW